MTIKQGFRKGLATIVAGLLTFQVVFMQAPSIEVHAAAVSTPAQMDEGDYIDFSYTGGMQSFTAPFKGDYKLEVWGAQGGGVTDGSRGGYGGYSCGNTALSLNQTIYICVGGAGLSIDPWGAAPGPLAGGYNGGGSGDDSHSHDWGADAASGGGATHIGKSNALLQNTAVSNLFIVAGGGGGATRSRGGGYGLSGQGGSGGGVNGGNGLESHQTHGSIDDRDVEVSNPSGYGVGRGGTQSAGGQTGGVGGGGSYGQGGSGGGGGGWYGGQGAESSGGGSGYTGGVPAFTYQGVNYAPSMSSGVKTGNGQVKITMVKKLEINIIYDANGGSGYMDNTIISADDYEAASSSTTFATKTNTYTRTGYDFSGTWVDNNGNTYDDGHAISRGEIDSTGGFVDRTWYAKWVPHTYTIRYNKNGADNLGGVVMDNDVFTYHDAYGRTQVSSPAGELEALREDATTNLAMNAYTKTGYHFVGWSTKSLPNDTDTIYEDGYGLCDISPTNNAVVTLYAQWEPNTYFVVVHDNATLATDQSPIGDHNSNKIITCVYDSWISLSTTINQDNTEYAALHPDEPILVTGFCYNPSTCNIAQTETPTDQATLRSGDGEFAEFPINSEGTGYDGLDSSVKNLTAVENGYIHVYCIRDIYRIRYKDQKPTKVMFQSAGGTIYKVAGVLLNDDGTRNRDYLIFGH